MNMGISKNQIVLLLSGVFLTSLTFGQSNERLKLIELYKYYSQYCSRDDPSGEVINDIRENVPDKLKPTTDFIIETISLNNNLLTKKFLTLPDDQTIRYINIVGSLSFIRGNEDSKTLNRIIDSLENQPYSRNYIVENYYRKLFKAVGNKIRPFNMSDIDFKLQEYNLSNDSEIGIFFLECMKLCNAVIRGYMNSPAFASTQKAYNLIRKYPKFNGQVYYKFHNFSFPDFQVRARNNFEDHSFKEYFIDKYFETLISHYKCLIKENAPEDEKIDILQNSILHDKELFKYSKQSATLNELFKN
jgi:hypothetical protein